MCGAENCVVCALAQTIGPTVQLPSALKEPYEPDHGLKALKMPARYLGARK